MAERAMSGQVVLVPWHTPGHWTYGALRLADGEVIYHDSLGGGVGKCTDAGAGVGACGGACADAGDVARRAVKDPGFGLIYFGFCPSTR